jgi:ATP phosphoribosyltransferase
VVGDILSTQSVLIGNPNAEHKDLVKIIRRRIEGYITATKYNMIMYNVSIAQLAATVKVTPGKRSPTITNLDDGINKAVSALVLKKEVSEKMDALELAGATDILVIDLANSRM